MWTEFGTIERARRLLASISFMPGTRITADVVASGIQVRVQLPTVDAEKWKPPVDREAYGPLLSTVMPDANPLDFVQITRSFVLSPHDVDDPDRFRFVIYREFVEFLRHEVDEWLRFDGKHYEDPHPESDADTPTRKAP